MGSVSRFTVSVPSSLLQAVDKQLVGDGETRSAVIRRLLEEALRDVEEQADIERYVRGWQEKPMTDEDMLWDPRIAVQRLAEHPWEWLDAPIATLDPITMRAVDRAIEFTLGLRR
jgi:hypothetical protein